jgi:hypothetical protein
LVFLIAAAPLEDMKGTLQPVAIGDAAGLFKKLCFDPFPESAKFTALIADPTLGFVKKPKTPSEAMQPGDIWYAPNASVTYSDADWLPRDLPSPQCTVTVALEGAPTHAEVASAVAAALALPAVKSSGSPARATSQWDMPGRGTDKFRLFLNTQALPSGSHEANLILLNLRGKKKND